MEKATFAAGCFWHVEETFRKIPGVVSTTVGFMGGRTKNPSYEDVCTGTTGHAEVVHLTFDSSKISYEKLLDIFWENHDPTTLNKQGPDVGAQYRSAVFYHTYDQKTIAEASKKKLQDSKKFKRTIVTEITAATAFYPAEEYHQRYLEKHRLAACPR